MKKLSVLTLSAMLLAACGAEESGTAGTAGEEQEQSASVQTAAPEESAKETEEPKESAESEFGKRSNPIPVGQSQLVNVPIYDNESNSFAAQADIKINSVERGESVLKFVQGINEFNEAPPEGYEYMMLDITAKLVESETEDYAWFADGMMFNFIGGDGSPYEWTSVVVEPSFSGEVYAGGSLNGKVVNMVKKDDPILLVLEDANWDNVFFATK